MACLEIWNGVVSIAEIFYVRLGVLWLVINSSLYTLTFFTFKGVGGGGARLPKCAPVAWRLFSSSSWKKTALSYLRYRRTMPEVFFIRKSMEITIVQSAEWSGIWRRIGRYWHYRLSAHGRPTHMTLYRVRKKNIPTFYFQSLKQFRHLWSLVEQLSIQL